VAYQRAGERITPRAGQALVFGSIRFFHDGRELFLWRAGVGPAGVATSTESAPDAALDGATQDTSDAARVAIYDATGRVIGHLVLGRSTPADAARLLERSGGLGPARDNAVTFRVGPATLRPSVLYTPPRTMHQLYFQHDTLVLVVAGVPHELPGTRGDFERRFPGTRETHREPGWYELQVPLNECVWLIAVFGAATDRLDSIGYARVC
jgi:hypothetical protein